MSELKHYHVYERMKSRSGRDDMYRCIHPECNHYAPRNLIIGKYAICSLCLDKFLLTPYALSLKVPHCGCRKLTPLQRENLRKFGESAVNKEALALQILQNTLKRGM